MSLERCLAYCETVAGVSHDHDLRWEVAEVGVDCHHGDHLVEEEAVADHDRRCDAHRAAEVSVRSVDRSSGAVAPVDGRSCELDLPR